MIHPKSPSRPAPAIAVETSVEASPLGKSKQRITASTQTAAPPSAGSSAHTPVATPHGAEEAQRALHEAGRVASSVNAATSGIGRDELEINLRLARAPGDGLVLPMAGAASTTHVTPTAMSLGNQDTHVSVDRVGVLFNQAALGGDQGLSGQVGTTMGLLFGSVTQHLGPVAIQGYAGGIGQTSVVGASVTKTIGHIGVVGGASLVVSGDTRLRVLTHHDNRYQMEYQDAVSVAGQMVGGVSSGHLGLGIRIGASKVRMFVYRSWVSPKEAENLTKKRGRIRDKLSLLRIRKPLLPIPSLADPMNEKATNKTTAQMKVGDELSVTYTGTLLGGISVTGGGVYLGAHVSLAGTHQLEIKKISDFQIELSVVPGQKSQAIGIGIDLPIVAESHVMMSRSRATRHAYLFDLRQSEAASAYQKAIDGVLPGPLYEVAQYTVLDAKAAQNAVANAEMPVGVSYQMLEQSAVPFESSAGGGMTLPRILPYANLAGVGVERRFRSEQNVIATRDVAIHETSTRREVEVQNLHRGSRETASYGSLQMVQSSDEATPSLGGVTVGVAFSNDRTQRKSRNKIIEQLQAEGLVDADLDAFSDQATTSKYEYEVKLERVISKGTLERTAPDGASAQQHAEQVRSLVTHGGAAGLASLGERFRNTRSQLRISVNSTGPEALLQKVVDLAATYQKPINILRDKQSAIEKRIKDVNKYLERIATLRQDIEADPLLQRLDPENKETQLASLDHSEAGLKRLVRLDHIAPNARAYFLSKTSNSVRKIVEEWNKKGML